MTMTITHVSEKKVNDNRSVAGYDEQRLGEKGKIILPLPPENEAGHEGEMEVYARFMRHLRHVPRSRDDIKVLTAIQFVADMLDYSDGHVARILVDLGLRAPRFALPADYLNHVDRSLMRGDWDVGAAGEVVKSLRKFWDEIGEDKFAWLKKEYVIAQPHHRERVKP